ncbi:hypothetical protein Pmani_032252 [Petrolisthes manimaculis]|uniref:Uncharacterized protein n=1 Tax=Petrolisthes manimaculis TaxID=1843537 RepID=A0AAE1NTP1_9EUCA|nr:hypothetical protein Pmani_032252 [Petrolisthes manimaculis]
MEQGKATGVREGGLVECKGRELSKGLRLDVICSTWFTESGSGGGSFKVNDYYTPAEPLYPQRQVVEARGELCCGLGGMIIVWGSLW